MTLTVTLLGHTKRHLIIRLIVSFFNYRSNLDFRYIDRNVRVYKLFNLIKNYINIINFSTSNFMK